MAENDIDNDIDIDNDSDTSTTEVVKKIAKVAVFIGTALVGLAEIVTKGIEVLEDNDKD
ncbi:hypothetical protein [Hippea alviniae]|uniref:hypothetical protein n=1 Tax=Hippea alviniae TaxID=1279027 RepID=UPI0003B5C573|nr:hypothetical protein [Hippea alviniae]